MLVDVYDPPRRADRRRLQDLEARAALAVLAQPACAPGGGFPAGRGWRISPDNAWHWFQHRFERLLNSEQVVERLNVSEDELLLLVYDLGLYQVMVEGWLAGRGPRPPALVDYLTPGREHWGTLGLAEWGDAPE